MDRLMDLNAYWSDIDLRLKDLIKYGFVKLPSLKVFNLETIADEISNDMKGGTFSESCPSHKVFLDKLSLEKYLTPKLYDIARSAFHYRGDLSNQYHIARRVEPGNSKEMYRAHFDSHLFTMVLPIKIPPFSNNGSSGELIYFPNARPFPKNEIHNIYGKASHKKFASKEGLDKFSTKYKKYVDDFKDYEPLLFVGNTTLHTNKPVSLYCTSYRLTLLSHFFDPSPKYGIGSFLRLVRSR